MKLAIVDLDGVIVNSEARFARARREDDSIDWNIAFEPSLVSLDTPIPGAKEALNFLESIDYVIVYLTSRSEIMRVATRTWLKRHGFDIEERTLLMKDYITDRYTKTAIWKANQVRDLMKSVRSGSNILFIDDKAVNREAVEALGAGIVCKADLSDYIDADKPIIL